MRVNEFGIQMRLSEDEYASSDGDIVILYMMTSVGLVVGVSPRPIFVPKSLWNVEGELDQFNHFFFFRSEKVCRQVVVYHPLEFLPGKKLTPGKITSCLV